MDSWVTTWTNKLLLPERIEEWAGELKSANRTIATLNGSFDLLHAGHLWIIFEASQQADVLLLALNSDDSIKRYKGEDRPIISLEQRLQLVSALSFVDFVTYFEEDNPCALLEKAKPDVHVNGVEYGPDCVEAQVVARNGGRIHLVPKIEGLSTTNILQKVAKISHAHSC